MAAGGSVAVVAGGELRDSEDGDDKVATSGWHSAAEFVGLPWGELPLVAAASCVSDRDKRETARRRALQPGTEKSRYIRGTTAATISTIVKETTPVMSTGRDAPSGQMASGEHATGELLPSG